MIVAVDLWQKHGFPAEALARCDSARIALQEPRFLARQRAACLFSLDRLQEGSDELVAELRTNALNLPLIRKDLMENAEIRELAPRIAKQLAKRAEELQSVPSERILAANLWLIEGDDQRALDLIRPLGTTREAAVVVLQNTATLAREMPLLPTSEQQQATTRYLLALLQELSAAPDLENSLRTRLLDIMAGVCEEALNAGTLADDPEAAIARLEEVLMLVKKGHPLSAHLYSAQIRLARYKRDVLGEPLAAAASLERLLTDLELPLEGVALARLTLGECYLAAGDTARGRLVLTRLGHSSRYREAAGHAHFHLARLDLAEGHWETARDRFASVALDNPMAAYANDALDLGLAIAEELDNPTGGPSMLQLYARSVHFDLTAQPDSQRTALEDYLGIAERQLDLGQPQHLLERARFELAQAYWSTGLTNQALQQCDRIVLDHPDGRYPATALALRGEILAADNQELLARESYQRLLMQYPDYLFADNIRDRLRSLP
jgi:tetratricopeptide (TPR) repeat protein